MTHVNTLLRQELTMYGVGRSGLEAEVRESLYRGLSFGLGVNKERGPEMAFYALELAHPKALRLSLWETMAVLT